MSLMLHAGSQEATMQDVLDTPTPPNTDTHFPIPHARLIGAVRRNVERSGWQVQDAEFGLWDAKDVPGAQMFGIMTLNPKLPDGIVSIDDLAPSDHGLVVGIRNSHNKLFSASMAIGSRVFVCDNLAFSGEITIARKHTRFILRDLDRLVAQAVGKISALRVTQELRIESYRTYELDDAQVHDLLIRSVDAKVMANSYIPKVLDEWREPSHEEFEARTAWSLFNGFTEVFKQTNPLDLSQRTTRLHGLMDMVTGALVDDIDTRGL